MLHLNSFNVLNNNCVCKSINKNAQRKVEKRLKELNDLLGCAKKLTSSSASSLHLPVVVNNEKIIATHWNTNFDALNIILSNGLIAWLFFDSFDYTSLTYVYLDKYLIGKIQTAHIVDVVFDRSKILFSYTNSKLTCVEFNEVKPSHTSKFKKSFKLNSRNVKVLEFDLELNCGVRRVEQHLILDKYPNEEETLLCVWWQNGSNTLCPWSSPLTSSRDLANVFIYNIFQDSLELVGFQSIPTDILKISFSKTKPCRLLTIENEQKPNSLTFKEYQLSDSGMLNLITCSYIAIPCPCLKVEFNLSLDKVLILCEEKTIILFNIHRNTVSLFKVPINAIKIVTNPLDSFFIIADNSGQIMMYDYGLHVMSANYDNLCMRDAPNNLSSIEFLNGSLLCIQFMEEASLILITLPNNLDYVRLISAYVKNDYINEALENLQSLDWNINSYLAYSSLLIIFNHLLKDPLSPLKESQLELTLACFYTPAIPIDEEIIEEYKSEIRSLAKKFFFHLYRYSCLEKAFLLALDLNSRHLFLLLYKIAKERCNLKLADVAFHNICKLNGNVPSCAILNHQQAINQNESPNTAKHVSYYDSNSQLEMNNNKFISNNSHHSEMWPPNHKANYQTTFFKSYNSILRNKGQSPIYLSSNASPIIETHPKPNATEMNYKSHFYLNGNYLKVNRQQNQFNDYNKADIFSHHSQLPQSLQDKTTNFVPSIFAPFQDKEPLPLFVPSDTISKVTSNEPLPIIPPKLQNLKLIPPPLPPKKISTNHRLDNIQLSQTLNLTLPAYDIQTLKKDYLSVITIEPKDNLSAKSEQVSTHLLEPSNTAPDLSKNVISRVSKDQINDLKIECVHFGVV